MNRQSRLSGEQFWELTFLVYLIISSFPGFLGDGASYFVVHDYPCGLQRPYSASFVFLTG